MIAGFIFVSLCIHVYTIHEYWLYAMFAQTLLNMLIEQMPQIVEHTCGDNIE